MTPVSDLVFETLHSTATEIFTGALAACNIESAFDRRIRFEGNVLRRLLPDGSGPETIDLSAYKRIFVIALGKAAEPMLDVLLDRMKRRKGLRGICCTNQQPRKRNWRFRYFEGGHPLPNEDSFAAARATLALLKKARKDTLIFFLISGGGSAMFDLPLDPASASKTPWPFTRRCSPRARPSARSTPFASISPPSRAAAWPWPRPRRSRSRLLLPDVPLRSLDALSSGPTSPDHSTVEDVRYIMDKYDLGPKLPAKVRSLLRARGPARVARQQDLAAAVPAQNAGQADAVLARASPPPPPCPAKTARFAIRSSKSCFRATTWSKTPAPLAQKAGYFVAVDNSCDDWDYADAARYLLERFHSLRAAHPRLCLISGGEVTVTMDRTPGRRRPQPAVCAGLRARTGEASRASR